MSGLMMSAAVGFGTTRREDRHRRGVVDGRDLAGALDLGLGPAGVGDVLLDLETLGEVDVHRRHPVVVGEQVVVVAGVVEDHALCRRRGRPLRLLATRPLPPRRQSTILPVTLAGSSESSRQRSLVPANSASTSGSLSVPRVTDAPVISLPLSSLTVPWKKRRLRVGADRGHPRHVGGAADRLRAGAGVAGRHGGRTRPPGRKQERDGVAARPGWPRHRWSS